VTAAQAQTLGKLIAKARSGRGLTTRELADQVGVAHGWLSGMEAGRFLEPAPDRLARLADALDIEPARIDRITKGSVSEGLPGMRTYFRAKYDLTPEQIGKVEGYIRRLRGDS
jgi:transcriptional regulator with XRE-family HTH domain